MKMKRNIIVYVILIITSFISFFPILYIIGNSMMSEEEITERYTYELTEGNNQEDVPFHFVEFGALPKNVSFRQFFKLFFTDGEYLRYFWNSVLLVLPVLIGQCIISPLAAYGFEQIKWKYKEVLYYILVIIMLIPTQLMLVPNFIVAGWLNIRNTYLAIILPSMFHPLGFFLVRQQLKSLPKDIIEAARLDGAGEFIIYRKIIRPNINSVISALILLLFIDGWNNIEQALVFIKGQYNMPLSVMMNSIMQSDISLVFSVSVFSMLPAVIVFINVAKSIGETNTILKIK